MQGGLDHGGQLLLHGVGQLGGIGDENSGGERVVFGLAHEVGSNVTWISGLVGQDGNLGRTSLRVDADGATQVALGSNDIDVARSGDHVDPRAGIGLIRALDTVGEHGDGLGAADGIDLVNPEQVTQSEDVGVRQATELSLRGRCADSHEHRQPPRPAPARFPPRPPGTPDDVDEWTR